MNGIGVANGEGVGANGEGAKGWGTLFLSGMCKWACTGPGEYHDNGPGLMYPNLIHRTMYTIGVWCLF